MNQIHTPSEHIGVFPLLDPESRTADTNSASVDCRGYEEAMFITHLGAHDRTTGDETLDIELEESDDDSTFTDVADASFTQIGNVVPNATKGNAYVLNVDLSKRKRYLRVVLNVSGTTPIVLTSVLALLFNPRLKPVTQPAVVAEVVSI